MAYKSDVSLSSKQGNAYYQDSQGWHNSGGWGPEPGHHTYGNCTWWAWGRASEIKGSAIQTGLGDAKNWFSRWSGSKDGGTNGQYIGNTAQAGDILVLSDTGLGHVAIIEAIEGDTFWFSDSQDYSGWSGLAARVRTSSISGLTVGSKFNPSTALYVLGILHLGGGGSLPEITLTKDSDTLTVGGKLRVDILCTKIPAGESVDGLYRDQSAGLDREWITDGWNISTYSDGGTTYQKIEGSMYMVASPGASSSGWVKFYRNFAVGYVEKSLTFTVIDKPVPTPETILTDLSITNYVAGNLTGNIAAEYNTKYELYYGETSATQDIKWEDGFTPTSGNGPFSMPITNTFESLMPNDVEKQFYLKVQSFDSNNYERGYQTNIPINVTVPEELFHPDIEYMEPSFSITYNDYPISINNDEVDPSKTLKVSVPYKAMTVAPDGFTNAATITEVSFETNAGTLEETEFPAEGTLSVVANNSAINYNLILSGTAKDSREFITELPVQSDPILIYGYSTPELIVKAIFRCNEEGIWALDGNYLKGVFELKLSCEDLGNSILLEDIKLKFRDTIYSDKITLNENNEYEFIVGGEDNADDFASYIIYQDDIMKHYSIAPLTSAELIVKKLAFSLLDTDINNVGASFGKEASIDNSVEFAPFIRLVATDQSTGKVVNKSAYEVIANASGETESIRKDLNDLQNEVGNIENVKLPGKQNKLIAGTNIIINEVTNTISATGGTAASGWTEIIDKPFETIGENLSVVGGKLNAVDTKYSAGTNITITDNVISASTLASWSSVTNKPFESIGSGLKVEDNVLKATATGGLAGNWTTEVEGDSIIFFVE